MTTLCGTWAAALLLERNAAAPPAGAGMLSVTVAVDDEPPVTVLGFRESPETASEGAVPHCPAVPPPPQVSPKSQPQEIVPPQPSGSGPHGPPCTVPPRASRQVVGVHPPVTVSGFVTGVSPGAPDTALMATVVVRATELAACTVAAP